MTTAVEADAHRCTLICLLCRTNLPTKKSQS